jgi:DNA-binding transcriptional LysR family regulator
MEQADRAVAALLAGDRDSVRVGTFQSISVKVLPAIITRLREERPGVEITLFEHDDIRVLVDRLAADELDLAFLVGPLADPRVDCEWFCHDRFVLLSSAPESRAAVAPRDLHRQPLVGMPATPCQALIDDGLRAHGVAPIYVFRSSDNGAVQAMVRAGMGQAVMPFLAVDVSDPGIVVREIEPALPDRVIGLARRRAATTSPAAGRFAEIARDVCAEVVDPRPARAARARRRPRVPAATATVASS